LAAAEIPPLDSNNPIWIKNVKDLAQSKALSVIANSSFQQNIFEKLLSDRILKSTLPFTVEQTEFTVSPFVSRSFEASPSRAASPIYSDSEGSVSPSGYEKALNPRHRAHKAFVRTMLKTREHSPDTSARLQSFLDTPSRPIDSFHDR
jgi:hypothetical protein